MCFHCFFRKVELFGDFRYAQAAVPAQGIHLFASAGQPVDQSVDKMIQVIKKNSFFSIVDALAEMIRQTAVLVFPFKFFAVMVGNFNAGRTKQVMFHPALYLKVVPASPKGMKDILYDIHGHLIIFDMVLTKSNQWFPILVK